MIYSISGTVTSLQENSIILAHGGLEYELICPTIKNFTINQTAKLFTYQHWSAENGPSFFGFETVLDKDLFLLIISCQGIGPKLGISILQQSDGTALLEMISKENMTGLSAIKGLGPKKAELLCMSLKEKAPKMLKTHPQLATQTSIGPWSDLQETLTSLNYSSFEIKQTTSILKENLAGKTAPFDTLLRQALTILAKK